MKISARRGHRFRRLRGSSRRRLCARWQDGRAMPPDRLRPDRSRSRQICRRPGQSGVVFGDQRDLRSAAAENQGARGHLNRGLARQVEGDLDVHARHQRVVLVGQIDLDPKRTCSRVLRFTCPGYRAFENPVRKLRRLDVRLRASCRVCARPAKWRA
jgi:hypothetical protein